MKKEIPKTNISNRIRQWIHEFVIGLNLCPFASHPFDNDLIRIEICDGDSIEDWVPSFINECNHLCTVSAAELSTTLIVFPNGMDDFLHFLDVYTTFEEMLETSDLDEKIQLASFHPDYQFADTSVNEVTNYTNRAPYPVVHLLRVDEVSAAVEHYGDTQKIFENNIEKMQAMGIEEVKRFLA